MTVFSWHIIREVTWNPYIGSFKFEKQPKALVNNTAINSSYFRVSCDCYYSTVYKILMHCDQIETVIVVIPVPWRWRLFQSKSLWHRYDSFCDKLQMTKILAMTVLQFSNRTTFTRRSNEWNYILVAILTVAFVTL